MTKSKIACLMSFQRTGCFLFFLLLISCQGARLSRTPIPEREMRAVWVATVANIDWPTTKGDTARQKQEFRKILDFYSTLNFNALFVQIRTAGDALYPSEYAPWSGFLTGEQGRSQPDILPWMIETAHNRGFEFHAWINPYRATTDLDTLALSPNHAFHTHRDWLIRYGTRMYFDPGKPEVQNHLHSVIREILLNYDIDGIHFDDYFYPYKIEGELFTDSASFSAHSAAGQSLEDWRRANVDTLVKRTSLLIRNEKPWLQFGISPFGVWRNHDRDPRGSRTKAGQTNYDDLYADPLQWMKEEWVDYINPQIYWSLDYPPASHRTLVDWWTQQDFGGNLYIGNGWYKVKNNADVAWDNIWEIPSQVVLSRQDKEVDGNVFFSARSMMKDRDRLVKKMKKFIYPAPALVPVAPFSRDTITSRLPVIDSVWMQKDILYFMPEMTGYRKIAIYEYHKDVKDVSRTLRRQWVTPQSLVTFSVKHTTECLGITFLDAYGYETPPRFYYFNNGQLTYNYEN